MPFHALSCKISPLPLGVFLHKKNKTIKNLLSPLSLYSPRDTDRKETLEEKLRELKCDFLSLRNTLSTEKQTLYSVVLTYFLSTILPVFSSLYFLVLMAVYVIVFQWSSYRTVLRSNFIKEKQPAKKRWIVSTCILCLRLVRISGKCG